MTIAEARERAQLILGLISLVIWFAVAYALAVNLYLLTHTQRSILLSGVIALGVAAVPWLGYRPLVRRLLSSRRGTQ